MQILIDISEEDFNIICADEDFPSTNEETLWRLIDAVLSGKRISEIDENRK